MTLSIFPKQDNITSIQDHYGIQTYFAPNGEFTSLPLYKLVGDAFFDGVLDTGVWTSSIGVGGSATVGGGQLTMSTGVTANNAVSVQSNHTARFSGLAPNKCRIPCQCPDGGTVNNTRRWGVYTTTDGAFFELVGTTLRVITRKAGVDTAITTFNGQYGTSFTVGANSHFYEIIYQPRQVVWIADNKIIHTLNAAASMWTDTLHLPLRYENFNSGGSTTNVDFQIRLGAIARFGIPEVQKDAIFQQGLTAGITLKLGPGSLHELTLSSITNNSVVTIYDNTTAAGTVLFSTGAMPANSTPFSLSLGGVAFNIGLSLSITGAACNAYIVFD